MLGGERVLHRARLLPIEGQPGRGCCLPDDLVGARFELRCEAIGFHAPPVPLRFRLLRSRSSIWSIYVAPTVEVAPSVLLEWLAPARPKRAEFGGRGVMRADFETLP